MDLHEVFAEIGFDTKETQVYLFLLENGSKSQQQIADGTNILRQTIYDVVKKMLVRGYVTTKKIATKNLFDAVPYEILIRKLQEREELFNSIIPELQKRKQQHEGAVYAETFIGTKGVKNLINMTLDSKKPQYWIDNFDASTNTLKSFFWENFAKKRLEKNITLYLLEETATKKESQNRWKTNSKIKRYVRRHPALKNIDASFVCFEDKLAMYSHNPKETTGVLIQNASIAKAFEKIFKTLWDEAKEN
jgi:sugar-specific transcriptional regulator TrmB